MSAETGGYALCVVMFIAYAMMGLLYLAVFNNIKYRLDMMFKVLRSFLDIMNELDRQIDAFRKITEPEAFKEEEKKGG